MNILGIHLGHDAAIAVIKDNRLVALIEKERLTRRKYDRGFSQQMLYNALETAQLHISDIDHVAVSIPAGNKPEADVAEQDLWGIVVAHKSGAIYRKGPRQMTPWLYEGDLIVMLSGIAIPASQVQHHIAHCASSYYLSNFQHALCFSYDGSGFPDNQNSIIMEGHDTQLDYKACPQVNSALYFGQAAHRKLGNWRDSGKLMGLAAYGSDQCWKDQIEALGSLDDNYDAFAKAVARGDNQDVAASAQAFLMDELFKLRNHSYFNTELRNLCLSGGGALNIYGNAWLSQHFDATFCPPYCKDSGLAAGGALYVLHHINKVPRQEYTLRDITFLGPGHDVEIKNDIIDTVAERLTKHNDVVFWHQGCSEGGPRALSHRSIFALPHIAGNKDRVSQRIKGREWYRPLAPICTAESASRYFRLNPDSLSHLMLTNAEVLDDALTEVIHKDGTARVQTVTPEFNPAVHRLLKAVEAETGYPILINTSLNILGTAINECYEDTLWSLGMSPDVNCAMMDNTVMLKQR